MGKVLAVVSGGLDSVTMAYELLHEKNEVDLISFDYGQRHKKELVYARALASAMDLRHDIVDLTGITSLISNSALTSDPKHCDRPGCEVCANGGAIDVPEGHYAEDNMKATVVPNRNMIMLSIAAGVAVNRNYNWIATAVHAGDHFIYPDCRPRFINAANAAIVIGNEGFGAVPISEEGSVLPPFIITPFLYKTKAEIAYRALELGVPLHLTWSCYKGGENHCGRCGTCVERLEAIDEALRKYEKEHPGNMYKAPELGGRHDFTVYDDNEFWKAEVIKAKALQD